MKIKQNIDEMHILFGKNNHMCKDCKHLFREGYHYRCAKWGEHSEWCDTFQACNLWEENNGMGRL